MEPIKMLLARKNGRTLLQMSKEIGCSAPYLHCVLTGKKPAGPTILKYLGLTATRTISYRKHK
jgi:hypothetical protein